MNASPHIPVRADGALARQRLLKAALTLFAEKGFAKASTREIAEVAQCNLAAINYYFGDKRGLYQAVLTEAICDASGEEAAVGCAAGGMLGADDIGQALKDFFRAFLQPLKQGEKVRLVTKLHFREILEPTGLMQEFCDTLIRPLHEAMRALLARHFQVSAEDAELVRLALAIQGMGVYFFLAQDTLAVLAPDLTATPEAVDILAERLALYALGMVQAETGRRADGTAACA